MITLPLPEIIIRLAGINHCDTAFAEKFLSEFSTLMERTLSTEGTLHIKGIGTFRRIELGDEVTVAFAPDDSLAEAVNAPFAMFEPIELDDDVTMEMLEEAGNGENEYNQPETEVPSQEGMPETDTDILQEEHARGNDIHELPTGIPPVPNQSPKTTTAESANEKSTSTTDSATASNGTATKKVKTADDTAVTVPVTHERIIEKERVVEVNRSHHTMNLVLTGFIALLAGLLIGYFTYDKLNLNNVKSVNISADDVQVYHQQKEAPLSGQAMETEKETRTDLSADSLLRATAVKHVENETDTTKANDIDAKTEVVTDTVRSNRFLTTMAQQHYGKKKFWVYIYLENRDKLGDPDKIAANTIVVIPPASKYGIRPGDPASETDAERQASEIMSRYSKNN